MGQKKTSVLEGQSTNNGVKLVNLTIFMKLCRPLFYATLKDKKLSYRRETARCVVSVEILPIATQHCSTTSPEQIEVMKLEG